MQTEPDCRSSLLNLLQSFHSLTKLKQYKVNSLTVLFIDVKYLVSNKTPDKERQNGIN